jgi:hypothetical protein
MVLEKLTPAKEDDLREVYGLGTLGEMLATHILVARMPATAEVAV